MGKLILNLTPNCMHGGYKVNVGRGIVSVAKTDCVCNKVQ